MTDETPLGWQCPLCKSIHSPWVTECPCPARWAKVWPVLRGLDASMSVATLRQIRAVVEGGDYSPGYRLMLADQISYATGDKQPGGEA